MGNEDLRDLLKSGYDTHAAQLHSGDDFAARHHGRVLRSVGRRRMVRQTAVAGGALASVSALAVGGLAIANGVNRGTASPLGSPSASPSPSALASPSPSPSPSPTPAPSSDSATGLPAWVAPLPSGPPQGDAVDNGTLRLVLDAQAPAPAAAPPMSVACGAPAGPYVAPVLVDATARILRPDTIYPTFLDPSYVPQPGDPLLDLQFGSSSAERFFVAVSTVDHSPDIAYGGSADYNAIAQQGVLAADSSAVFAADDVDFLYGAVVVQGGAIIGHADLWSRSDGGAGTLTTALSTVNEVSARDADTQLVYDYAVGPLEHMLWCGGAAPTGTVDTYAVVGTRLPSIDAFDYSMMWAGAVEYK